MDRLSVSQAEFLKEQLRVEQSIGNLKGFQLHTFSALALTPGEYRKLLNLMYNKKTTELEKVLLSLGCLKTS